MGADDIKYALQLTANQAGNKRVPRKG